MPTRSLEGTWQLRCPHPLRGAAPRGLGLDSWMPVTMPGTVHFHLQKLGKIPDPYQDRNELLVQWVDGQDWELRRSVEASESDCQRVRQELIFDGLDTVATITLNGREVGHSINMFRQVVCDVKGALTPGENELRILLASPTAYTARAAAESGHPAKRSDFEWQTGEKRSHHREWIRKVQCHFGWDWGVYLATSGVWQPAYLDCSDAPRIAAVITTQNHRVKQVKGARRVEAVELEVAIDFVAKAASRGRLTVRCGGVEATSNVKVGKGEARLRATLTLLEPRLWWPAGEGEQPLYDLEVTYEPSSGGSTATATRRVGLRTMELVTAKEKKGARSFLFRVNGRDIYARGANWIPVDQLVDRAVPGVYRHLLESAVAANMNMIRVWGGGWYEQDVFYALCDELGLLVWQDFMMACELYPAAREFVAELTAEATYQVRRLQHHACIALWCGDNENAEAVATWWGADADHARVAGIYKRTLTALKATCEAEDPTRRFWLSSPSNDEFGEHPNDPNRGDVHYWKVWHGRRPFSDYLTVKPRFVSEFGFQSFPEPRTIRAVVPEGQVNPSSRVMEHHQRSPDGNLLITNTMAREMPIPKDFDTFCHMSQINQAMAIRTAVEHWRRLKPWCMGTLYWQLNDLWPVASWSSIDYHGRWKVLQHAATRFFAPVLVSLLVEEGELRVWVTSDVAERLTVEGELDIVTWDGRQVARVPLTARVEAGASRVIAKKRVDELLVGGLEAHEVCVFVRVSATGATAGAIEAENFTTLVPWKWVTLVKPEVRTTLRERAGNLELVARVDAVTPFFHAALDGEEGRFRGDWQVLRPGRDYVMTWVSHVVGRKFQLERASADATQVASAPATSDGAAVPVSVEALHTLSLYDLYAH